MLGMRKSSNRRLAGTAANAGETGSRVGWRRPQQNQLLFDFILEASSGF
jgi:hypothetical protein